MVYRLQHRFNGIHFQEDDDTFTKLEGFSLKLLDISDDSWWGSRQESELDYTSECLHSRKERVLERRREWWSDQGVFYPLAKVPCSLNVRNGIAIM